MVERGKIDIPNTQIYDQHNGKKKKDKRTKGKTKIYKILHRKLKINHTKNGVNSG
jgi:hypothetical protein